MNKVFGDAPTVDGSHQRKHPVGSIAGTTTGDRLEDANDVLFGDLIGLHAADGGVDLPFEHELVVIEGPGALIRTPMSDHPCLRELLKGERRVARLHLSGWVLAS